MTLSDKELQKDRFDRQVSLQLIILRHGVLLFLSSRSDGYYTNAGRHTLAGVCCTSVLVLKFVVEDLKFS